MGASIRTHSKRDLKETQGVYMSGCGKPSVRRKSPTINRQHTGRRGLLSLGLSVLYFTLKNSARARAHLPSPHPHPSACAVKFPSLASSTARAYAVLEPLLALSTGRRANVGLQRTLRRARRLLWTERDAAFPGLPSSLSLPQSASSFLLFVIVFLSVYQKR